MKNGLVFFAWMVIFSQCTKDRNYNPDQLAPQEKDKIMMSVIRYVTKAPENVTAEEKFSKEYDEYYLQRASLCRLEQYYSAGEDQYFLISQPAPSLVEKRHATGGKMKMNKNGKLVAYEEVFRTWKMTPDTLKRRSYLLFDKMVKGEPLTPFLTKNSPVEYIEFPDEHTFYDRERRSWETK